MPGSRGHLQNGPTRAAAADGRGGAQWTAIQGPGALRRGGPRRWLSLAILLFVGWLLAGFVGGHLVTRGRPASIPARVDLAGHAIEAVATTTADGLTVRGWLVRARPDSRDCAVLATGIRGNRSSVLAGAEWYLARGWSALVVDLRATGESDGGRVSMGWHEAADLRAWHALLRERGFTRLCAHGQSLGAAAIAYSDLPWDLMVLESCYVDIDEALRARLPWVPFSELLLWPLRRSAEWWSDTPAVLLRPGDALAKRRLPTLFLCGLADTKVGIDGTQRLAAACAAADERVVLIAGAGHQDLLAFDRAAVLGALASFVPVVGR